MVSWQQWLRRNVWRYQIWSFNAEVTKDTFPFNISLYTLGLCMFLPMYHNLKSTVSIIWVSYIRILYVISELKPEWIMPIPTAARNIDSRLDAKRAMYTETELEQAPSGYKVVAKRRCHASNHLFLWRVVVRHIFLLLQSLYKECEWFKSYSSRGFLG